MLSIVIPTLNEEKNLVRLLRSLKKQTFKDFEVVVADAGSKDDTVKIALNNGAQVVKGGLPGVGRNAGAEVAKGELIFFFDADVVLTPTFLERTLKQFKEKNLDVASCLVSPISEKRIDKFMHEVINVFFKATERFLPHAPGFCILIKKSLHEKIGGFDESVILAEDHDYVKRASKVGKFRFLTNPKINVSVRRLDRDGRFNITVKYIMAEAYILFIGEIRNNIFDYKFAHYDKVKKARFQSKLREKFLNLAKENVPVSKDDLSKIYNEMIESFSRNGKSN